jgi:NAD(P)-dependent dehydrogenase (short-subunit alcohol dehydrogenase family)
MGRFDLEGKVVLVTGGERGIGYETARIAHAKGAAVALVDLDSDATERAARSLGERAIGLGADVTDRDAMDDAVGRVAERLGGLDVVVANAGIAPRAATMRAMDRDVFERVIDVNVLGVWRTVEPALPHVIAGGGQVVVVASIYAFMNGALLAPYAVAKAGVEQLGRALRAELAQHGASASVAYFGFIDTEMTRSTLADPIAERFEAEFPGLLRRRLRPEAAGAAIVRGIERRAPRIIAPRRWAPVSALRGLLNPLADRHLERDAALQAILRDADQPARAVTIA